MIYTPMTKKACNIMYDAHRDDFDKGGYPYVFHPFILASQMQDEDSCCVALLHDVIEDHGDIYSIDDLKDAGFGDNIIEALKLLTHNKSVPYMDYVKSIGTNKVAIVVKIADLKHNMDVTRTGGVKPKKYDVYKEALEYLTGLL